MSSGSAVNIGTLQGVLEMRDLFSAQMDKFEARLKMVEEKTQRTSKSTKTETDKIGEAYKKVAASLDPVVANTQKYDKAAAALGAALKAGVITQEKYNASLSQAKEKYLSANASTLTWREEIQNLTGKVSGLTSVMGPLGGGVASLFSHLSALLPATAAAGAGLTSLTTIGASISAVFASASAAVRGFIASISGPVIAAFAAIVVAAAALYGALTLISSGFNLVSDAVSTGLKTQLVIDKLNKSLALNGSAAGLSARELVAYAEALELSTTRSKEEIVAAETILSRFDSLGKETYPRALKLALSMAKATGDTADSMAKKLGPALEGSIRSLNSWREMGVVFTSTERKKLQALLDTGDVVKYQTILFDILESKIGTVGESTDKNLTRQMARAQIVLEDFQEGIASEVIPVLEDLTQELIDSVGGWDALKAAVSDIGHSVGDVIRTAIYAIIIDYHNWQSETYGLTAGLLDSFSKLAGGIASATGSSASLALSMKLSESANEAANSAYKHATAAMASTNALLQHRTALEGDAESHERDTAAADRNAQENEKLSKALDKVAQSIEEMLRKAENARSLYIASTLSLRAYNEEALRQKIVAAILAEDNKLRELGRKLTDEQRNAIASAIITEDQFTSATRRTLDARRQLEVVTSKLALTMSNLFKASTGSNDAAMGKLLDKLKEAKTITESVAGEEEKRVDAVSRANSLYSQGLISAATYQKIILANADSWNIELTESQERFLAIQERMYEIADGMAHDLVSSMVEAAKRGESIWSAAGESIKDSILSAVQSAISEWLAQWFRAMAQWLARWIATQAAAKTASASLQGPTQSGGNLSGLGSAASSTGASAGTLAGYAVAAYALYVVYKGFIEDHKRKFGSITITNGIEGSASGHGSKFIKQVQEAASVLLKNIAEFTKQLSLDIKHYGTAIITASKSGFTASDSPTSPGKLFKSMEEAAEYAQVLMLKYAEFSDSVSFLVQSVIESTKAINLQELAADIDFASILDTQNLEAVASDMRAALDLAISQWQRSKDLWLDVYGSNLPAFAEAAASIITKLTSSLTSQYNSLMGIKENPEEAWKRQAIAYNAQRAIILAQIKLWELEIQARIASYNVQREIISGGPFGKRRADSGGEDGGLNGFAKAASYAAGVIYAATVTMTEGADAGMQALLDIQKLLQDAALSIPDAIDPTKYPGAKGAGGGAGGQREAVRDWMKDRKYDLDTRALDEWAKKASDISRQYDEQIAQAGKDAKLRAELIVLKERELELLKKEQIDSVVEGFRDFLGLVSPFDQVRKTASDLIKQIEDSPLGNDRKARMIERALADIERQTQALSDQMTAGLFGDLAGMMEDGVQKTALLRAQFILNSQLQLADAKARFALLVAEGKMNEANKKLIEDAIGVIEGYDPGGVFDAGQNGNGTGTSGTPSGNAYTAHMEAMAAANEAYIKRMQTARDLLKKYTDQGIDPLTRRIREINADFVTIAAALGNTPAIIQEHNEALAEAYRDATSGIRDFYNDLLNGPASAGTVEQQYNAARAEYERVLAEIQSGDYSELEGFDAVAENFIDLLGQMFGTSTGGFQDIRAQVLEQLRQILALGGNSVPAASAATGSSGAGFAAGNAGLSSTQYASNLLTFPPQLVDNSRANVDATRNIAEVINIRSGRQEILLKKLVDIMGEVEKKMTPQGSTRGNLGYGD